MKSKKNNKLKRIMALFLMTALLTVGMPLVANAGYTDAVGTIITAEDGKRYEFVATDNYHITRFHQDGDIIYREHQLVLGGWPVSLTPTSGEVSCKESTSVSTTTEVSTETATSIKSELSAAGKLFNVLDLKNALTIEGNYKCLNKRTDTVTKTFELAQTFKFQQDLAALGYDLCTIYVGDVYDTVEMTYDVYLVGPAIEFKQVWRWLPIPGYVTVVYTHENARIAYNGTVTANINAPVQITQAYYTGPNLAPRLKSSKDGVDYILYDRATNRGTILPYLNKKSKWKFDGNANDSIYNSNGTPVNCSYTSAKMGQGISLNGSSSYVGISNYSGFNNMDSFTLAAWVNPKSLSSSGNPIITKVSPNRDFVLQLDGSGRINFHMAHGSTYYHCYSSSTVPVNSWTHVAATFSGGKITLYQNGNKVGENTYSGLVPDWTGTSLQIGSMCNSTYFNGILDEVGVYAIPLTADQIKSEMTSN